MANLPWHISWMSSETYVWLVVIVLPILAVWSAWRPVLVWPLDTRKFLEVSLDLLREGNEERLKLLAEAGENIHLPQLVAGWLEGGREQLQKVHLELTKERLGYLIKQLVPGSVIIGSGFLQTIAYRNYELADSRLIVSTVLSHIIFFYGLRMVLRVTGDCQRLADEGIEKLELARSFRADESTW